MNTEARAIVEKLGLEPLPHEGGWFRRTWRSTVMFQAGRAAGSAIYFVLTPEDFSALHRLQQSEIWHFYAGDAVWHWQLDPADGAICTTILGAGIIAGEVPQLTINERVWQGARLQEGGIHGWALVGCTTVPEWIETEFELGRHEALTREFPAARAEIEALTR